MLTKEDTQWIEYFSAHLRANGVSGEQAGDAVATVREHLADSGERAVQAFGLPHAYAASLGLPVRRPRTHVWTTAVLPVTSLFSLLALSVAAPAWNRGELLHVGVAQAMLLLIPVLLVVALPFLVPLLVRMRWAAAVLLVVGGAAGALASLVAPKGQADAWFSLQPGAVVLVTSIVLLAAAITTTALLLRDRKDVLIEPFDDAATRTRRTRAATVSAALVGWLFPFAAAIVLFVSWLPLDA